MFFNIKYQKIFFAIIFNIFFLVPMQTLGKDVAKLGFSIYSPPIYFEEEDHFKLQGLSVDIAIILADKMNVDLQFFALDDIGITESIDKKLVDFIICVKEDIKDIASFNIIETNIRIDRKFFANKYCTTFESFRDLPGHTVILRGDNFVSRLLTSQKDISLTDATTIDEVLGMVDSGKVQVYVSHSSLLDMNTIEKRGFRNIIEVGTPIKNSPLVIATHIDNDQLYSALEKACQKTFKTISYNAIASSWINRDLRFTTSRGRQIGYFLEKYSKHLLFSILLILSTLLLSLLWNTTLKRKVRKVTRDLNISERKYKSLIESSPDIIFLLSPHGEIKLSNKIASDILEYDKSDFEKVRIHDLVIPEQKFSLDSFLYKVFKENYSKFEFSFKTKSGAIVYVEMVATIVQLIDNENFLACCFSRDLTERKKLEERLLHADRLSIMGQMTAGIAHEINNPLGIISTNAEELINYELERDESLEVLKTIQRNTMRAGKIIEDLLSFTCPSPLNKTDVDFIQLINESLSFLKPRIKKKNITIRNEFSAPTTPLLADEKLMQQLVMNLLLNGVQAVNRNGFIKIITKTNEKQKLVFDIIDNGIGISGENLEKIFDPFFTHRKEGGFGLGLFVTKIIIEKHNGRIAVASKENEGTHFTVELPLS